MAEMCSRKPYVVKARDWVLNLGERTLIMGILNVTPDSFSDKGRYFDAKAATDRAWQIAEEGADILDIGGESTRPGSQGVSIEEELQRVIPAIEALASGPKYPIPISVDTTKPEVAKAALEAGACIINDISSLRNSEMGATVAKYAAALILMHMRGEPGNMQSIPPSDDILGDIEKWAQEAVARASNAGVSSDKIVLDPGIGFGKTAAQNFSLLRHLNRLAAAGFPILTGTSRKSFITSILKKPAGEQLIMGTSATVVASIMFGAHIVRVHDVAPIKDVVAVADALLKA
jgi:dihydropteroate synthase